MIINNHWDWLQFGRCMHPEGLEHGTNLFILQIFEENIDNRIVVSCLNSLLLRK